MGLFLLNTLLDHMLLNARIVPNVYDVYGTHRSDEEVGDMWAMTCKMLLLCLSSLSLLVDKNL